MTEPSDADRVNDSVIARTREIEQQPLCNRPHAYAQLHTELAEMLEQKKSL